MYSYTPDTVCNINCHCHHDRRSIVAQFSFISHYGHIIQAHAVCSTVCSRKQQRKHQKVIITGLCDEKPPVTSGFPSQWASYYENVAVSLRYYDFVTLLLFKYVSSSYTSRDIPKSDILSTLSHATKIFLAAKSRWTNCKDERKHTASWKVHNNTFSLRFSQFPITYDGCKYSQTFEPENWQEDKFVTTSDADSGKKLTA